MAKPEALKTIHTKCIDYHLAPNKSSLHTTLCSQVLEKAASCGKVREELHEGAEVRSTRPRNNWRFLHRSQYGRKKPPFWRINIQLVHYHHLNDSRAKLKVKLPEINDFLDSMKTYQTKQCFGLSSNEPGSVWLKPWWYFSDCILFTRFSSKLAGTKELTKDLSRLIQNFCDTVDGQNPAPPRMMIIPSFIGF